MSEREVLAEFSAEITDALYAHEGTDEAVVLMTCMKRLSASDDATMTAEARVAFARLIDVPETALDATPHQARAAHTYVAAARQAERAGLNRASLGKYLDATR